MRTSTNQLQAGVIQNGFSYKLQVWIRNFIIQDCGHPDAMACGCHARTHRGEEVRVTE